VVERIGLGQSFSTEEGPKGRSKDADPGLLGLCQAQWRHQAGWLDLEGLGESLDGFQADGPPAPFDQADVGSVQTGGVGESFLRQALPRPQGPHLLAGPRPKAVRMTWAQ